MSLGRGKRQNRKGDHAKSTIPKMKLELFRLKKDGKESTTEYKELVKRIESTERLDRAKKAELRRKKEQEKEEIYVKSDKTGMKFFEFIRKATRRPEHVDALRLNGEIRHDKEGMKEAAREEFRSRFEGVNKAPKKDRRPPMDDGHLDEEVNKELTREEFDSNLKDLKNGRSGGIDGIKNELLKGSGTNQEHFSNRIHPGRFKYR